MSDPVVAAMMPEFTSPERLTLWSLGAMAELGQSICRDLKEKQLFAFLTRLRQPEELYIHVQSCPSTTRCVSSLVVAAAVFIGGPLVVLAAVVSMLVGLKRSVAQEVKFANYTIVLLAVLASFSLTFHFGMR